MRNVLAWFFVPAVYVLACSKSVVQANGHRTPTSADVYMAESSEEDFLAESSGCEDFLDDAQVQSPAIDTLACVIAPAARDHSSGEEDFLSVGEPADRGAEVLPAARILHDIDPYYLASVHRTATAY